MITIKFCIVLFFVYCLSAQSTGNRMVFHNGKWKFWSASDTYHTAAQPFSDFRLESLTPLLQEVHMDPTWLEFEVDLLLILYPAEIEAPGTPGVSHGTKIFGAKFFSYHPLMNLFYEFCGLVMLKMPKIKKNCLFLHNSLVIGERSKYDLKLAVFLDFWHI